MSFDDDKNTLADAVDKYCIGVPPIQWLAWIPQLLTCLVGSEGKLLLNLISQVGMIRCLFTKKVMSSFHILLSREPRCVFKVWQMGQRYGNMHAFRDHLTQGAVTRDRRVYQG